MQIIKKSSLLLIPTLALLFVSCQLNLPVEEMVNAKLSISKAYQVKADEYAKDYLEKSLKSLYSCHNLLEKEKDKKAKEAALMASKYANLAVKKSLPLLSKDYLDKAEQLSEEAKVLFAEQLTPSEFSLLVSTIKNAASLKADAKHWESYLTSQEALKIAQNTISKILEITQTLKPKIEELTHKRETLVSNKFADMAEEELAASKIKLEEANYLLANQNYQNIGHLISEIEDNLNKANNKIQKSNFIEIINKIIEDTNTLIKNKGEDYASEEIESIENSLNKAEEYLDTNEFDKVSKQVLIAENSLKTAQTKMKKYEALEKIKETKELYNKIESKIDHKKENKQFNQAKDSLAKGESLWAEGKYALSIVATAKAHSLLKTISSAPTLNVSSNKYGKYPFYYIVKSRKINTDCLWRISLNLYKNAAWWPKIYRANKDKIKNVDLIYPGQKFLIPPPKKKNKKRKGRKKRKK